MYTFMGSQTSYFTVTLLFRWYLITTCSVINQIFALFVPFIVEISCDPPNNRLDKFKGKLAYEDTTYPLDNENVILRVRL